MIIVNKTDSDEGSAEIDKLLAELENETLPEESSKKAFKRDNPTLKYDDNDEDVGLAGTRGEKHEKPEWADKKNDEFNTYEYKEDEYKNDKEAEDW